MNSTLHTLRDWSEQGWLRRLDSALADFVAQHDPQAEPALLVATALLAHMEGRGHVCLPLLEVDAQWSTDYESKEAIEALIVRIKDARGAVQAEEMPGREVPQ